VVLSKGRIIEQGSHDELLQRKGSYFQLVETQRLSSHNARIDSNSLGGGQAVNHGRTEGEWGHAQEDPDRGSQDRCPALKASRQPDNCTHYSMWTTVKFIAAFNRKETHPMMLGLLFSIVAGTYNIFLKSSVCSTTTIPGPKRLQICSKSSSKPLLHLSIYFSR
jgi:ATP-binding cassette subfamily B (MDR/TAP) protein 1